MNPRQISQTGVDGITPFNIGHAVKIKDYPSLVLIVIFATSLPCGLNKILQVANKQKSTSPALVRNTQKLDAVVGEILANDLDSASIFSKVIGHKLSNGPSGDL